MTTHPTAPPRRPLPVAEITIPTLIILGGFWVAIGRMFFGSIGWMMFFLIPAGGAAILYGVVIGLMFVGFRSSRPYRPGVITMVLGGGLAVSLFVFGATVVDFGDTADSGVSVVTRIAGANSATEPTPSIFDVSNTIAAASGLLAMTLLVGLFVWLIVEFFRTPKPPPTVMAPYPTPYPYPPQGFAPPPPLSLPAPNLPPAPRAPPWRPPHEPPPAR